MALGELRKFTIDFSSPLSRLYLAAAAMTGAFAAGTIGYMVIGHGQWSLLDCAYMTVITLTTVGYGETIDIANNPAARLFTMILIVSGMGTILFFVSSFTAFVVEGQLRDIMWKNRIRKEIDRMKDHIIVCGVGETGFHIVSEMVTAGKPLVMVDTNEDRLRDVCDGLKREIPYIVGDAADDDILTAAGIQKAHGLIAACTEDRDNLIITISAKQLNSGLRIIAKSITIQAEKKLLRAGATKVVSTNKIGGMRLASEMLRPAVVTFLDRMLQEKDRAMRIEEVAIRTNSSFIGKTLADLEIRKRMELTVMAIEVKKKKKYIYNPEGTFPLDAGMTLICLGKIDDIIKLREMAAA